MRQINGDVYMSKPIAVTASPSTRPWTESGFSPAARFVLLLLALCFCYVTYRALHLELTSDESEVLNSIHRNRYHDLVFAADWNSQVHFLNALLAKPCVEFLPLNEIVASRIPSLFGLLLFLWGVWKIGKLLPTGFTRVLITLALVSNAFLLDYLALSRGYGLALGLCMLSLSFLLDASLVPSQEDPGVRKQAIRSLWLAFGSALSNMAFLYFYAALLIAIFWLTWRRRRRLDLHCCTSAVLLAAFYLPRMLITRKQNSLSFGGTIGFVHDTIASLVRTTFYDLVAPTWLIGSLSIVITVLVCFLTYWSYREEIYGAFILSMINVLVGAFCTAAHIIWKEKYPIERCAVFLIPLVILDIGMVAAWSRFRWLRLSLWGVLLIFTGVGISGVNLSHTQTSRKNADIASVLLDLREMHKNNGRRIQIAFSDGSKWTTWYYAEHLLGMHHPTAKPGLDYLRTYEWLTLYEWRGCQIYLVEAPHYWFLPGTTHALLDEDDVRLLAQFPPGKVAELKFYPASGMRLFALTGTEYQGSVRFFDGSKYAGEFKDGQPNGSGTLTDPSGNKYVGEFVNGHSNGHGTATWLDGGTYVGQFKDDLPFGLGTLMRPDGRVYTGQFRDGKMDGLGKMTYPDGKVEEGLWKYSVFIGAAQ
jgi:hypothetical protein